MSRIASKENLLVMLDVLMQPKKHGLNQQAADRALIDFCASCPDPVLARWLVAECLDPMTDEELVSRALAMPIRPLADVPTTIVPAEHPVRTVRGSAQSLH
nr:hypothetical protein [Dyella sp. ASV24]